MTEPHIRPATSADRDSAIAVLASAFAEDPQLLWFTGESTNAEQRLMHLFGVILGVELKKAVHAVEVVDGGGAAAVWHEVDDWETSTRDLVRSAPAMVRTFGRKLPRAMRALTMIEKVHPAEPHLHLAFIGVHSDSQGQGLGGALLSSMTARCDAEGLGAYLESSNPRNQSLYVRHGFVDRGLIALPPTAPPLTAMWREPRG